MSGIIHMRFFDDFKSHHANFIHVISYKGGKILWQIDSSCGVLDVLETSCGGKLLDPIPNSFPDTYHKTWVSPNMKGTAFYGHFNWVKHDQSEWNFVGSDCRRCRLLSLSSPRPKRAHPWSAMRPMGGGCSPLPITYPSYPKYSR